MLIWSRAPHLTTASQPHHLTDAFKHGQRSIPIFQRRHGHSATGFVKPGAKVVISVYIKAARNLAKNRSPSVLKCSQSMPTPSSCERSPACVAWRVSRLHGRLAVRVCRSAVPAACRDDSSQQRRQLAPITIAMLATLALLAACAGSIAVVMHKGDQVGDHASEGAEESIAVLATANGRTAAQPAPISKQRSDGSTAVSSSGGGGSHTHVDMHGGSSKLGSDDSIRPTGYVGLDQIREPTATQGVGSSANSGSSTGGTTQSGSARFTSWRLADDRCGARFSAPDGTQIGQCDPASAKPCCSRYGWCGGSDEHCFCESGSCVDYRAVASSALPISSAPRPRPMSRPFEGAPKAFMGTLNTDGLDTLGLDTSLVFPPMAMSTEMVGDCRNSLKLRNERTLLADQTNFGEREPFNDLGKSIPYHPQLIVLHETVGSAASTINFFRTAHPRDADQASYHVMIERDGTLIRFVPDGNRAFGAGSSAYNDFAVQTRSDLKGSINNVALHVSLESPADGRGHVSKHSGYTDQQYRAISEMVLLWQARYGIPFEHVTTHQAVDRSGMRSDPRSFSWSKFDSYHKRACSTCLFQEYHTKLTRPPGGWGSLQAMRQQLQRQVVGG